MAVSAMDAVEYFGDLDYEYRLIWEARLAVDQKDRFFFDHPLDHIPAMMLVEGALRLAGRAAAAVVGSPRHRFIGRVSLSFARFCELSSDPLVRVWAGEDGPGRWRVEFVQDDVLLGLGELEWRGLPVPSSAGRPEAEPVPVPAPVAAELVHRARPQNVLIGGHTVDGETHQVTLLTPPPGHYFRRSSPDVRPLGEVLEGLRQFGILLGHEARDVALGRQFVVKAVEADLGRPLRRGEPVLLRSAGMPRHRGRGGGRMTFTVHAAEGEQVGTALIAGTVVSAETYQRIRRMTR